MKRFFRIDVNHWIDLDAITSIILDRMNSRYLVRCTVQGIEEPIQLGFKSKDRRADFMKVLFDGSSLEEFEAEMKDEYEMLEKTIEC